MAMTINLVPEQGDKNFGIEIINKGPFTFEALGIYPAALVKHEKLSSCKLFVQCNSRDYIFLESWQSDQDKVIAAAEYLEAVFCANV
jgi:hypothetical protein